MSRLQAVLFALSLPSAASANCTWTTSPTEFLDCLGEAAIDAQTQLDSLNDSMVRLWGVAYATGRTMQSHKSRMDQIEADLGALAASACTVDSVNGTSQLVRCGGTEIVMIPRTRFESIGDSAGTHRCGVDLTSSVVCWGAPASNGRTNPPPGAFAEVATGSNHTCALDLAGVPTCWGDDQHDVLEAPSVSLDNLTAGAQFSCGLNDVGEAVCWGDSGSGRTTPAPGPFAFLASSADFACGVRSADGGVDCWGFIPTGQVGLSPTSGMDRVALGNSHSCGITSTFGVECWGQGGVGQTTPPSGQFTEVAVVSSESCAVNVGGDVQCWGANDGGAFSPPVGTFTEIHGGGNGFCAVRAVTGDAVCWGAADSHRELSPP